LWRAPASLLRAAGHEVFTPTLTGLCDRVHLAHPDVDLDTHIQDIVGVLQYEDLHDVILVGASYAGMVITGVAERVPERLGHLVYVDGVVPEDGEALIDLCTPQMVAELEEKVRTQGDGWRLPADPLSELRITDHPFKTFLQPVTVGNPAAAAIPRTYICCTDKPDDWFWGPVFYSSIERVRAAGWRYHELPSGHTPMLSMPQELTDFLLELL
jgi:pimeloyl-ACP methyl ester carboxylesterase